MLTWQKDNTIQWLKKSSKSCWSHQPGWACHVLVNHSDLFWGIDFGMMPYQQVGLDTGQTYTWYILLRKFEPTKSWSNESPISTTGNYWFGICFHWMRLWTVTLYFSLNCRAKGKFHCTESCGMISWDSLGSAYNSFSSEYNICLHSPPLHLLTFFII